MYSWPFNVKDKFEKDGIPQSFLMWMQMLYMLANFDKSNACNLIHVLYNFEVC